MNDQSPRPGWWQASDGNWYPPETHPDAHPAQNAAPVAAATADVPAQYIPPVSPQPAAAQPPFTHPPQLHPQPTVPQPGFAPAANPYPVSPSPYPAQPATYAPQPQHGGYGFGGPPGPTQNVTVNVKRGRGCFTTGFAIVGVIVVIGIVLAALGGGSGDGAAPGGGDAPVTMNLGQPAPSGPFDITVVSVQNPYEPRNEFGLDSPPSGKKYVAFELAVTNTSDEMQVVSTLFGAELSDSIGQNYSEAFTGTDLPALSGEAAPGETRRGWVLFEVPQDAVGLQLKLRGGITAQRLVFNA